MEELKDTILAFLVITFVVIVSLGIVIGPKFIIENYVVLVIVSLLIALGLEIAHLIKLKR